MVILRHIALLAMILALPRFASAQADCPFVIAADFPVSYVDRHIPVVTVTINGQAVHMMVDTGSGMSFITTATYNQLNLADTYPTKGAYATGVAGTMQVNTVVMQDIGLGATTLQDEVLGVSDSAAISSSAAPVIGGVLGNDIMQLFDIGLDLPNNHIVFYRPPDCAATQTPWLGDFAPMPITRHKETLANTVDYGIDNAVLAATIDTGAEASLVAQQALSRAGVTPEATMARHGGIEGVGFHRIAASREQFSSITVGAESFGDIWLPVVNSPMADTTDVLIGEDYLATHRVFIANSSNTAFFGLTVP